MLEVSTAVVTQRFDLVNRMVHEIVSRFQQSVPSICSFLLQCSATFITSSYFIIIDQKDHERPALVCSLRSVVLVY